MEFLGTRGEWEYGSGDNTSVDIVLPNDTTITVDRCNRYNDGLVGERIEMEANALLVSKAYQLLENAQMRVDYLDLTNLEFYEKYGFNKAELIDRTRVLIKESTELK